MGCFLLGSWNLGLAKIQIISYKNTAEEKKAEYDKVLKILQNIVHPDEPEISILANGKVNINFIPATNMIGIKLWGIIKDTTCVELHLEPNTYVIGLWRRGIPKKGNQLKPGNGRQSIDLNDLARTPSYRDKNAELCVGSRESMFIHELVEAYVGRRDGINYNDAHELALEAEELAIRELHKKEHKTTDDTWYQRNSTGDCMYIYFKDTISEKISALKYCNDRLNKNVVSVEVVKCVKKYERVSFNGCNNEGFCVIDQTDGEEPTYSTIANTAEFSPSYFAKGPDAQLLVGDQISASVYLMDFLGNISSVYANVDMTSPSGIVYNRISSEIYIADDVEEKIFIFDQDGTIARTLSNPAISTPAELDIDADENIIVSNHGASNILVLDNITGNLLNTISDPNLASPAGIGYDIFTDQLYVVDNMLNRVVIFNYSDGTYQGIFAGGSSLASPWGMDLLGGEATISSLGRYNDIVTKIAIASSGNQSIISFDTAGTMIDSFAQPVMNVFDVVILEYNLFPGQECLVSLTLSDTVLTSDLTVQNSLFLLDSVFIDSNQNITITAGTTVELTGVLEVPKNASLDIKIEDVLCLDP